MGLPGINVVAFSDFVRMMNNIVAIKIKFCPGINVAVFSDFVRTMNNILAIKIKCCYTFLFIITIP